VPHGRAAYSTANFWDASSGKLIASFAHGGSIWQEAVFLEVDRPKLHFSPDGPWVLTIGADNGACGTP
jgi:hypothetical protein